MKQIILITMVLLTFLAGCKEQQPTVTTDIECSSDSDCITSGCSSTICQPASEPPVLTTCEYKEEYACYNMINCGCVEGKCAWQKTPEFEQCLADAQ